MAIVSEAVIPVAKVDLSAELRNIEEGRETVMDVIREVGEDGQPITRVMFGKRALQPEPKLESAVAMAKARDHEFHSIKAFSEYLGRECSSIDSVILADVFADRMTAVLDEDIETDRECVSFLASVHPLFAPWKDLIGKAIPVLQFALFVMQNRSAISEPDGRELAMIFSQIKSAKTVTKQSGIGAKSLNGVMVETMISGKKHDTEVELPESITIVAPLYLDTDPVEITLDLLVTDTERGIVVFVTAPKLAEAEFAAFSQFVDLVKNDTGLLVGFGRVQERPWNVVR